MPSYRVRIAGKAQARLGSLSPILQTVILNVIDNELRVSPIPGNLNEGRCDHPRIVLPGTRIDHGLRWRRCVTDISSKILDAGHDPGPAVEDACDFVVVYRVPRMASLLQSFERFIAFDVLDLLENAEIAQLYVLSVVSIDRDSSRVPDPRGATTPDALG